jgi:transposase
LSHESGKTVAEVARELDVRENVLHEWRAQVSRKGENVFPGSGQRKPSTEIEQLKRENKRLRDENAILKKSAKHSAKELKIDTDS